MYVAAEEFLKLGKCLRCSHRGSCHNQRLLTQRFCCSRRLQDVSNGFFKECRICPITYRAPASHLFALFYCSLARYTFREHMLRPCSGYRSSFRPR
ncbi:hypothetical protein J6590_027188, partial [Homalodisca vitripennis]